VAGYGGSYDFLPPKSKGILLLTQPNPSKDAIDNI